MSRIMLGVYLSPTGQIGLLETTKIRKFNVSMLWKVPKDKLFTTFDGREWVTWEHFLPYDFSLDEKQFLPMDKNDVSLLLQDWEFLGPLNSPKIPLRCKLYLRKGAIWKEVDDRLTRYVKILEVSDFWVKIKNIHDGNVTYACVSRFNGHSHNYTPSMIQKEAALLKIKNRKKHNRKKGK